MILSEFLQQLSERGFEITEPQLRSAIKSKRIPKPGYDASHRYNFTTDDVNRAVAHFGSRPARRQMAAAH